jgi:SWI/SNF-related matrix-associated actin-dependent regulator of chromatin subfamily A member 5
VDNQLKPARSMAERDWDVVITTYEVVNLERSALTKIAWNYLIIDEAHRLKNEASQFSTTVRMLNTKHRLLLTGTPLQNNLHELWALLNFLLPDIFASAEQVRLGVPVCFWVCMRWGCLVPDGFFPTQSRGDSATPFGCFRKIFIIPPDRVCVSTFSAPQFDDWFNLDVDDNEAKQRMISQLHKLLRPFMLRRLKADVEKSLPPKSETILFTGMSTVQKNLYRQVLLRDIDTINGASATNSNGSRTAILNIVMQLRKCCNHPYLFPGVEDRTMDPMGEHLYQNCGKMVLLHKLLAKMKERGHRVLIFSQMTRMIDILEDYMLSQGYQYCRIDGNTTYEVHRFRALFVPAVTARWC